MIEPGYLAIALLIGVPLNMAIGAYLARNDYAALRRLSDEVERDGATLADRKILRELALESTKRWPLWVAAATAPLWCIPLFIVSIFDAARGLSEEEMLVEARATLEESKALSKRIGEFLGEDDSGRHSDAFLSRRDELENACLSGAMLASPALGLWLFVWASPSAAVYAASGAAGGAWARLREAQHFIFARLAH